MENWKDRMEDMWEDYGNIKDLEVEDARDRNKRRGGGGLEENGKLEDVDGMDGRRWME